MSVYLGLKQIGTINLISYQSFNTDIEDVLIDRSISLYKSNEISIIGNGAFAGCSTLTSIELPNCSYIGNYAFSHCSNLTSVMFPNCTSIGEGAFSYCYRLTSINFPNCSYIESSAFYGCSNLLSLYLLGSSIPSLDTGVFEGTPISNYTTSTGGRYGSIFVPASLYNSYITATNWSVYSARIVSV